jgi:hypothetical protein
MKRKQKSGEPSLRDQLARGFLEQLAADFAEAENGKAVIEALRKEKPDKYAELVARLIAAREPEQEPTGIKGANSIREVGERLLQAIGLFDPSDEQIEEAISANNRFVAMLEAIRDRAALGEELN